MSTTKAYEKPLSIEVVDGEVVVRSPDGPTAISLTPAAAAETAGRLAEAAERAAQPQASQVASLRE
jgi:hypothetical protein